MLTYPMENLENICDEIAELCHKTGEPIYLTRAGVPELVIMDAEAFKRRFGINETEV